MNLTQPDILIGLLAQSSLPSSKFQQKDLCSPKFESSETKHQSDSPLPAGGRFHLDATHQSALACVRACLLLALAPLVAAASSISALSFCRDGSRGTVGWWPNNSSRGSPIRSHHPYACAKIGRAHDSSSYGIQTFIASQGSNSRYSRPSQGMASAIQGPPPLCVTYTDRMLL